MIELSEADLAAVRRILSLHLTEGQSVWAFGSRVKGTARPWSDLDLVVKGRDLCRYPTTIACRTPLRNRRSR
ncbi:nucleotidyltransferase domain-containing protein [Marinobacterium aestuariivivens]|uniref:Nucleotidyltransferase domain-containing protein n=1 Tax=Marinobacterium aestuariivivens TaxID=1698799 RepID=A0ABW2A3H4_9GAMM